jgi:hypothetical protein
MPRGVVSDESDRRRSTEERLRRDHIAMMELLQQKTDECERLKEELYLSKEPSVNTHSAAILESEKKKELLSSESEAMDQLRKQDEEILRLTKKVASLEASAKTVAVQLASKSKTTKSKFDVLEQEIKELEKRCAMAEGNEVDSKMLLEKSSGKVAAAEKRLASEIQVHTENKAKYEAENALLMTQMAGLQLRVNELSSGTAAPGRAKPPLPCHDDALGSPLEVPLEEKRCSSGSEASALVHLLQSENAELSMALTQANAQLTSLNRQVDEVRARNLNREEALRTELERAREQVLALQHAALQLRPVPPPEAAAAAAASIISTNASEDDKDSPNSERFAEFVELRKENKQLKLQLAQALSGVSGSSGNGSSRKGPAHVPR